MMKKIISMLLMLAIVLAIFPCTAFAAEVADPVEVIYLEDGSYIEIITTQNVARVANTVSGTKTYIYRDSYGTKQWTAVLSATFAYSGAWYICSTANCNVTIHNSDWYVVSNSTTRSTNNAITYLTMGRRSDGSTYNATIRLSCDSNGNLS